MAPFILQNFKKFLGRIQSYEDVPFLGSEWPICHEQNFFGTNHYYYFHLPIGPFNCAKFKKILTADPYFCAQKGPCAPIFFLKIINIILIYLLAPFIVQNFKKFFQQIQSYKNVQFFGPKMAPFLQWEFFSENMLLSLVSFIHAYLHAKNLSQILIY